jgi:hypothetical protein
MHVLFNFSSSLVVESFNRLVLIPPVFSEQKDEDGHKATACK